MIYHSNDSDMNKKWKNPYLPQLDEEVMDTRKVLITVFKICGTIGMIGGVILFFMILATFGN